MVHWTNLQWIEIFVNPAQLYITSERSGGLHLVKPGLTAGSLAGRQSGSLAEEIWARLEILKACSRSKYLIFRFKVLHCFSNLDALLMLFQANTATRLFYRV